MNNQKIGQFTAEIAHLDMKDLQNPRENQIIEVDKGYLSRIKRLRQGLNRVINDEDPSSSMAQSQLNSILKSLMKIEQGAEVRIAALDSRKNHSRQSEDISPEVLKEMETEFAEKKASAIVICEKAKEVREEVEKVIMNIPNFI
jgi:hypothetical protein